MTITENITNRIEKFEHGKLFSYQDFQLPSNNMEAMAAAFSRLAAKGIIKRFSRGKYFKPQEGLFGEVPLKENQILDSILKVNGRLSGYLTGTEVYNQMGLTTQMTNQYTIASNKFRKAIQKGRINIRFVKTYSDITEKNIPLLQLLDAVKDINSIPGTEPNVALELIKTKLKGLSSIQQKKLGQLALNYPPATRALIGAVLEIISPDNATSNKLYKSLNMLSKYVVGINENTLPNKNKWKIK